MQRPTSSPLDSLIGSPCNPNPNRLTISPSDPLTAFRSSSSSRSQSRPSHSSTPGRSSQPFRPPPPVTPSPSHSYQPSSGHTRYSIPSFSPPPSSQCRPMDDPFSRSFVRSPSNTSIPPGHSTPRAARVDHYRPESRASTSVASNTPRSAQEIYSQSKEKKVTGVDKILAKLEEFTEHHKAQNEKIDTMSITLTKLSDDNRHLREKVHELQLGQRSLATRDEIVEEITNQVTPTLNDNLQTFTDKLATLPNTIASLVPQITQSQVPNPPNNDASLTNLLNHVVTKLNGIDKLVVLLQNFEHLPEAITDVAVFKDAINALTAKVEEFSQQQQSQPLSQPTASAFPHTPTSSVDRQLDARIQSVLDTLNSIKQTCNVHTADHEEIRTLMNSLDSKDTTPNHDPKSFESSQPFDLPSRNSLDDLADAAFEASPVNSRIYAPFSKQYSPPSTPSNNLYTTPFGTSSSRLDTFSQPTYTPFSFQALASGELVIPSTADMDTGLDPAQPEPTQVDDLPIPTVSHGGRDPARSSSSTSSKTTRKSKYTPNPADRPITRSITNVVREPTRWNPSSHTPTNSLLSDVINSGTLSSGTLKGQSAEEAIEVSSGSSSSTGTTSSTKKRGRKSSIKQPLLKKIDRNIESSAFWSRTPSQIEETQSPNSGVSSLPSNESVPNQPGPMQKPPLLRTYGSSTSTPAITTTTGESSNRAQARQMEEEKTRRRSLTSVTTLGSAIGENFYGKGKKKRRVEVVDDDSFD